MDTPDIETCYLASFTKGLPHDDTTGLAKNPIDFQSFVKGIDSGDPRDFRDTRMGPDNVTESDCTGHWRSEKARKGCGKRA